VFYPNAEFGFPVEVESDVEVEDDAKMSRDDVVTIVQQSHFSEVKIST
jgi:hypothetical protein